MDVFGHFEAIFLKIRLFELCFMLDFHQFRCILQLLLW